MEKVSMTTPEALSIHNHVVRENARTKHAIEVANLIKFPNIKILLKRVMNLGHNRYKSVISSTDFRALTK